MIRTLKTMVTRARRAEGPHECHDTMVDLVESMLRHLAVVAITAYRHSAVRVGRYDAAIAKQLPWPSMGSWKNFLQMFGRAEERHFPEHFHREFLRPLTVRLEDDTVAAAYGSLRLMLDRAGHHDPEENCDAEPRPCSALDFFDSMVAYRNDYVAHGTQALPNRCSEVAELLHRGTIRLCERLAPLWRAYPVFVAKRETESGVTYHRLLPLIDEPGAAEVRVTGDSVVDGRLYVCFSRRRPHPASLYPLALWHEEEILFLNGTRDFREIKYLGFGRTTVHKTDIHEQAFCDFLQPFMGVKPFSAADLADARVTAHAVSLVDGGWRFPRLSQGMEVGSAGPSYRLRRKLGHGGMAEVWEADALETGERVAVKFLSDIANHARFRREARALQAVSRLSDRIVGFKDYQFDAHPARLVAFLVMELLPGKTLEDIADGNAPFTHEQVLDWMRDALEGLAAVHARGLVHRDVKPSNLMFDALGRLRLSDLGLAGIASDAGSDLETTAGLTRAGSTLGTPEFSSLEQLQGGGGGWSVGPRSDLFSLGASFYLLLTGEHPFGSGNQNVITGLQIEARDGGGAGPSAVHDLVSDCPRSLGDLVMCLIAVRPELRPTDARAALRMVEECRNLLHEGQANTNLNLLGDVGGDEVRFDDLLPPWYTRFVFWVFPIGQLAYLSIMYGLSASQGTLLELNPEQFGLSKEKWSVTHPSLRDPMFVSWNLLPFLLVALLWRVRARVQPLMQSVFLLDPSRGGEHWAASARRTGVWARVMRSRWLLLALLAGGALALYFQFGRIEGLTKEGELYFWHPRVNNVIHHVFAVGTAFHIVGLGMLFVLVVALIDTNAFVLRGARLRVDPNAGDGACGLSAVGRLLSLFLPFFAALGVVSAIATYDHRDAGMLVLDWSAVCVSVVLFFVLLLWPMLPVHRSIVRTLATDGDRIVRRRLRSDDRVRRLLEAPGEFDAERTEHFDRATELSRKLSLLEKRTSSVWRWPIRKRSFVLLVLLGVSPFVLAMLLLAVPK